MPESGFVGKRTPTEGVFSITSGVPFAKSALGSAARIRLLDQAGKQLPLQTETLARWEDGSVKWLLLDSQARAPRGASFTLEYGTEVRASPVPDPVRVIESDDAVAVNTGPMQFVIGKKRFGFIQSLSVDGSEVLSPGRPGAFYLEGTDGTRYTTLGAPGEVKAEERGPLRAVIRVSGHHQSVAGRRAVRVRCPISRVRRPAYLRVQHTFGNDSGSAFTTIRSLKLQVPLEGVQADRRWVLDETSGAFDGGTKVQLRQHTDDRYAIEFGGKSLMAGRRASGMAQWGDGSRTITLAVRDFWQNYQKHLAVPSNGPELDLCPELRRDEYANAAGTMDEHRI